ncbi:hypothetical protein Poly24_44920 [Rosistilla carotiformis]|uniref:Uncharacterized protein n=1 Tax=Rosistilla carotiformis TaxID=2528017 RepID=A0A518JYZ5_9BACT|nr:hypothetical protein Poly24_44920 [Rosistilla carotiformis]
MAGTVGHSIAGGLAREHGQSPWHAMCRVLEYSAPTPTLDTWGATGFASAFRSKSQRHGKSDHHPRCCRSRQVLSINLPPCWYQCLVVHSPVTLGMQHGHSPWHTRRIRGPPVETVCCAGWHWLCQCFSIEVPTARLLGPSPKVLSFPTVSQRSTSPMLVLMPGGSFSRGFGNAARA